MDMMEVRRRVMLSMASGKTVLWKSITLDEDHTRDATGLLTYWVNTFLNITGQPDFTQNVWCVVFSNNSSSFFGADFICISANENNEQRQASARSGWSDWSTGNARSLYASAGTVVNVYKLPK